MKGSDNVVADALSRYPEETGQSCEHLLLDEHDMDLVCHFFNLSSELSMYDFGSLSQDETVPHVDVSLKGNGADLLDSSTTPRAYSENVLEDLTLPLDPVSKCAWMVMIYPWYLLMWRLAHLLRLIPSVLPNAV